LFSQITKKRICYF